MRHGFYFYPHLTLLTEFKTHDILNKVYFHNTERLVIMKKITARLWASFILIGLVGQFAWTIENMYLNVYLYKEVSKNLDYIATMVAASAVSATLTTLLMGALTDKIGKRKVFICTGYILWGISTASFGFITPENMAGIFPAASAVSLAAGLVIAMDCIMTFFGSTANDAAFNAFVTDNTNPENRGKAESVLATLPLISMLIIFGLFGGMTTEGKWQEFFLIFGGAVTVTGIISIFLVKDAKIEPSKDPYFKKLIYGFRPSVIKANPMLYISLIAMLIFSIAVQIFFPYLIIYIQYYLKFENFAIILGIVLLVASVVSVVFGRVIDKVGTLKFTIPACIVMLAGLVAMFFVTSFWTVIAAGIVMMSGYMLVTAAVNATVRDYTPSDSVGHFQGVRMIFGVMLPMIIGPYIGSAVIKNNPMTYTDDMNQVNTVPTPYIFLAAAVALLPIIIPVIILKVKSGKTKKEAVSE